MPNWFKDLDWFSGPKPLGTVAIFVISTFSALVASYKSNPSGDRQWWFIAGWLLASVVIVTVAFNAARADQNALERARENRSRLVESAKISRELYEQLLAHARVEASNAAQAVAGPAGDMAREQAKLALSEAQSAAERLKIDEQKILEPDGSPDLGVISATLAMNIVVFIVGGLIIVSFFASQSPRQWASAMVWSVSCLVLGGLAGFLFGIPRVPGVSQTRGAAQSQAQIGAAPAPGGSTAVGGTDHLSPIAQIADWLTKTIVGLGLVNLAKLPGFLSGWAGYVSQSTSPAFVSQGASLATGSGPSFALGLILYFMIVGFLCGYLLTQIFLYSYVNK